MGNSISPSSRVFDPPRVPKSLLEKLESITPKITLLSPDDVEYKKNRIAFNYDVVGFPSLMIIPDSAANLSAALPILNEFSTTTPSFPISIAGGRHSHYCMEDGSILIDMQRMKEIKVNVDEKSVSVGAGTKLGELDAELAKFGLATPTGTNIDTGVCGLSLGGGLGYLTRRFGLSVDNILSIEVVLADGRIAVATEDNEYSDLFWAHRGGSGNWGVVTKLTFRTYKLSHTTHGACVYLFKGRTLFGFPGREVMLKNWIEWTGKVSNDVMGGIVFVCRGPIVATYAYVGDNDEEGKKMITEAKAIASPTFCTIKKAPYSNTKDSLQYLALKNQTPGYYYETSVLLGDLNMDVMNTLVKLTTSPIAPNKYCAIVLFQLGGAMAEVKAEDSAFFARNAKFWAMVMGKWTREAEADRKVVREWVVRVATDLSPYSLGSYNTLGADEAKVAATPTALEKGGDQLPPSEIYFGANIERLRAVKTKYDPHNLFRLNKNIRPNGWTLPEDSVKKEKEKESNEKKGEEKVSEEGKGSSWRRVKQLS